MIEYNILIIEDKPEKLNILKKAIEYHNEKQKKFKLNVFPIKGSLYGYASDIVEKSKEKTLKSYVVGVIKEKNIHLLILDFYLATRDEGVDISLSTGYLFLDGIRKMSGKLSRIPIFSYTKKQNALNDCEDKLTGMIQGSIDKKDDWKTQYQDMGILTFHRMLFESEVYSKIREVDILVVCAIKKEFRNIKNLWNKNDITEISDTHFEAELQTNKEISLGITAITNNEMGMAEAATLTTDMIALYNPRFVVMTGMAAGIDRNKQRLLDILIPESVYNWQAGKFKVINKDNNEIRIHDKDYKSIDTYYGGGDERKVLLSDKFKDEIKKLHKIFLKERIDTLDFEKQYDDEQLEKIFKSYIKVILEKDASDINDDFEKELRAYIYPNSDGRKNERDEERYKERVADLVNIWRNLSPSTHDKKMSSGSAVVADEKIVETFIAERGVEGIDMEAYGVVYACKHARTRVKSIIMKAVSDYADAKKNDLYQEMASYVSAQAFYILFTNYIDFEDE